MVRPRQQTYGSRGRDFIQDFGGHSMMMNENRSRGGGLYSDLMEPEEFPMSSYSSNSSYRPEPPRMMDDNFTIRAPEFGYGRTSGERAAAPVLDMDIQRKIASIQSRARGTRTTEDLNCISSDFRAPVLSSRMTLSDRFRIINNR